MNEHDSHNPYVPMPVTIAKIAVENEARDIKTFDLTFDNEEDRERFRFTCGQFAMISVQGAGESPIGIASSPLDNASVQFTVKRYSTGVVTTSLHDLEEGTGIGLRGPFGNAYPLERMKGMNVLIVGGGFAFTTLRSTIRYMLDEGNRGDYERITVIYGTRSPGELIYKSELAAWEERDDIEMVVTVDKGDDDWKGREGFVPTVLQEVAPDSNNAVCLVCGPPIMLKFTMPPLIDLGFGKDRIVTSLERRMSCGIGKCGRCNIGSKYVCKDGPVFTYEEVQKLPENVL
jgi:sulfhydrogenase subunit gamma (sulfur reductase)